MRRIKKFNSELNLYQQIATYLQLQYPDVIYRFDLAADLKLTPGQAIRHKKLHPKRGYPDLFIAQSKEICWMEVGDKLIPTRWIYGLYIELKKDGTRLKKKDGSWASEHIAEQAEALEKLRQVGYKAEFAVGFEQAKQIIDEYLKGVNNGLSKNR